MLNCWGGFAVLSLVAQWTKHRGASVRCTKQYTGSNTMIHAAIQSCKDSPYQQTEEGRRHTALCALLCIENTVGCDSQLDLYPVETKVQWKHSPEGQLSVSYKMYCWYKPIIFCQISAALYDTGQFFAQFLQHFMIQARARDNTVQSEIITTTLDLDKTCWLQITVLLNGWIRTMIMACICIQFHRTLIFLGLFVLDILRQRHWNRPA